MFPEIKNKACNDWRKQELEQFMQQLHHDPLNIEVLSNIGILYGELEEHGPAFHYLWQAYDEYKNVNPESKGHLGATMALATLHMQRQEYIEAKRKYWEAMQIDWSHQKAHDGLQSAKTALEANPRVNRFDKKEPVSIEVINMLTAHGPLSTPKLTQ